MLLDKLALDKEKHSLLQENQQLRAVLKQYLDGRCCDLPCRKSNILAHPGVLLCCATVVVFLFILSFFLTSMVNVSGFYTEDNPAFCKIPLTSLQLRYVVQNSLSFAMKLSILLHATPFTFDMRPDTVFIMRTRLVVDICD